MLIKIYENKIKLIARKISNYRIWYFQYRAHKNTTFARLQKQYPTMGNKVFRPYLSSKFTTADRLKIIIDHYEIINSMKLLEYIFLSNKLSKLIVKFYAKNSEPFEIEIESDIENSQEGEFFIKLIYKNICIQKVGGSTFFLNDEKCIFIANVQGPSPSEESNKIIREATKLLFKARSKDFLLKLVIGCAKNRGFSKIVGVGTKNILSLMSKCNSINFCYDSTWLELGGVLNKDGDYDINLKVENAIDKPKVVKSSKRSERKRREELNIFVQKLILNRRINSSENKSNICANG